MIDHLMADINRVTREDDKITRQTAIEQMKQLYQINLRWNLPGIKEFIVNKQKELMGW